MAEPYTYENDGAALEAELGDTLFMLTVHDCVEGAAILIPPKDVVAVAQGILSAAGQGQVVVSAADLAAVLEERRTGIDNPRLTAWPASRLLHAASTARAAEGGADRG